ARDCDRDVPILDWSVIALQHQRTRHAFVAVEGASSDSRNLLIPDYRLAVCHDRDHPPDERDVVGLPLSRMSRRDLARRDETVNAAEAIASRLGAKIVFDLDFVPSS